jgi:hypothetical protein
MDHLTSLHRIWMDHLTSFYFKWLDHLTTIFISWMDHLTSMMDRLMLVRYFNANPREGGGGRLKDFVPF